MTNLPPDDPRHGGSGHAYSNLGCRCDKCTEAHRARNARRRAERAKLLPPADAHGLPSTYSNWSCRCRACCEAWRVEMRRQYQARKAKANT